MSKPPSEINDFWRDYDFLDPQILGPRIEWAGITFNRVINAVYATLVTDEAEQRKIAEELPYNNWEKLKRRFLWVVNNPEADEFNKYWHRHITEWLTFMAAQRFGAITSQHDMKEKLDLGVKLIATGDAKLSWGLYHCDQYLGRCCCPAHTSYAQPKSTTKYGDRNFGTGQNHYGRCLEAIRTNLKETFDGDLDDETCGWCIMRENTNSPATEFVMYRAEGGIVRVGTCKKHVSSTSKYAKRLANNNTIYHYPKDVKNYTPLRPGKQKNNQGDFWPGPLGCNDGCGTTTSSTTSTWASSKKTWNVLVIVPGEPNKEEQLIAV